MRYSLPENPTIFGKILRGEIPCKKVYENDHVLAFQDIAPKAAVHIVLIPKQHLVGMQDTSTADTALLGHLFAAVNDVAKAAGIAETGYRIISNAGPHSGQEVPHLHIHLLGGEQLSGF